MTARHLVVLVEEPSMEAFLRGLLPRLLPADRTFEIHHFQCKNDLLIKLPSRLHGYAKWLPDDWRILVVVDRDDDDCLDLKRRLERFAAAAGLSTRTHPVRGAWQLVNRVAVEELEAWYFGDWAAVQSAYPRVAATISDRAAYRMPDAVAGGTWEAFERVLQQCGYFEGGLRKTEAARAIGAVLDPSRCRSPSFRTFHQVILEATA